MLEKVKRCENPACNKDFTAHSNRQKYCSQKCSKDVQNQAARDKYAEKKSKKAMAAIRKKSTFDKTLEKCRESGLSYAEYQIRQTLSMIPKIKLEL